MQEKVHFGRTIQGDNALFASKAKFFSSGVRKTLLFVARLPQRLKSIFFEKIFFTPGPLEKISKNVDFSH